MANDPVTIDERIATALERIAAALEQMNAVRIWPTIQPSAGTGGASGAQGITCSRCGTWFLSGTTHYCGAGAIR